MKQEEKTPSVIYVEKDFEEIAYIPENKIMYATWAHLEKPTHLDTIEYVIKSDFEDLKAKLEKACEALRFYGEPLSHIMRHDSGDGFVNHSDIDKDLGKKARAALKEIEEME